jgi:omega-6 fatty acid desaturase (delta-12 desaturase)
MQRSGGGFEMPEKEPGAARGAPAPARADPLAPVTARPAWVKNLKEFEKPSRHKVAFQLVNTVIPYAAIVVLMYLTMYWKMPYWITFLLAFPAGAFLVRIFIFFHDCGHGSFVASPLGQRVIGSILGLFTFSCFSSWRYSHGIHHSTSGNLDRRGIGDVWTMTMDEYAASSPFRRFQYRLFRNPFIMFGLGPILSFLINQRFPARGANKKQILNVILTDAVIAGIVVAAALTIGIKAYLLIKMPIMLLGGSAGIWLFYVQHQFDPSYWARTGEWESMDAAMLGSSYYKLPRVLQWISGNIGLHHVHHLRPRIPNYNLQAAVNATPELQLPDALSFLSSLKSVRLKIWDERQNCLLTFKEAARLLRQRPSLA